MSHPSRAQDRLRLKLEIAGIPFSLVSDSREHARWIPVGFRRFTTEAPPELELEISTSSWRNRAGRTETMTRSDGVWRLEAVNFRIAQLGPVAFRAETGRRAGCSDLVRTWFSYIVLERGGILLHAAGVVRSGRAMLFCGPSGSGKTTLARLAPPEAVLSDESVVVLPSARGGGFEAHPTPFFGEMLDVAAGRRAPLAEIFLIAPEHAADSREPLRLSTVTPAAAAAALLAQTFLRVLEPASLARLLPTVEEVAANARIRRLDFVPVPEIWSCLDDRCR